MIFQVLALVSTWKVMEMSNYYLKIMAHLHDLLSAHTQTH